MIEGKKIYKNEHDIPPSVKGEHLERPAEQRTKILLYDSTDPEQYIRFSLGEGAGKIFTDGTFVDYYLSKENAAKEGMLGGFPDYIFSKVDETEKRSSSYRNCVSLSAIAEDKHTGKQISFLAHQNPSFFLTTMKASYERDLRKSVQELMSRAKPGTVDVTIMGGGFFSGLVSENDDAPMIEGTDQYKQAIDELSHMVRSAFSEQGTEVPVTIPAGANYSMSPSNVDDADIALDTQARLLLQSRPKQKFDISNEVFSADDRHKMTDILETEKTNDYIVEARNDAQILRDESLRKAQAYKRDKTLPQDFVPDKEREKFNQLKKLHVKTFAGFERNDEDDIERLSLKGYVSPGSVVLHHQASREYRERKFTSISNLSDFLDRMIIDLVKISEGRFLTVDGVQSFYYVYHPNTDTLDYFIGGFGGYRYFENADTFDNALIQNVASFMKGFHTFLDDFSPTDKRSEYMKVLSEKLKEVLREKLPPQKYHSLIETFY